MKILQKKIILPVFILWFIAMPVFASTPNDPFFSNQWYLQKIGIPTAWETQTGSNQVIVAVLDAGLDMNHPDLVKNIWNNSGEIDGNGIDDDGNGYIDDVQGYDFVDMDNSPEPDIGESYDEGAVSHGTMIAGIIGATTNNSMGVTGINWNVKLMSVRILDNMGIGNSQTAIQGLEYAVANGAKVVNLSLTGTDFDSKFQSAVQKAHDAGVVVVAAVGNSKNGGIDVDQTPIYPACFSDHGMEDWILGVSSTDQTDTKSTFSNYGLMCTDIAAPGESILGAVYQNDYWLPFAQGFYQDDWSGTSMAAPMVSGSVALLFASYPNLSPDQIYTLLRLSVDPINAPLIAQGKMGSGRLNVAKAFSIAKELYPPEALPGSLVKLSCPTVAQINDPCKAVYFYASDGKRHAFPNDKVYLGWYSDFSTVKEVSTEFMSSLSLGKNVTYRPGLKLVKFQSVPTVYTVEVKGVLRAVGSEEIAGSLYGTDWNKKVDDISDVFFGNYSFGAKIESIGYYYVDTVRNSVSGLNENF